MPATNQRDSIQVLGPTKVYHLDDVNTCFMKNVEDDILKHLKKLPIIFSHHIFDLSKISMEELEAWVKNFHELQQADKAQYEAT